jgi:hypothetical protein
MSSRSHRCGLQHQHPHTRHFTYTYTVPHGLLIRDPLPSPGAAPPACSKQATPVLCSRHNIPGASVLPIPRAALPRALRARPLVHVAPIVTRPALRHAINQHAWVRKLCRQYIYVIYALRLACEREQ